MTGGRAAGGTRGAGAVWCVRLGAAGVVDLHVFVCPGAGVSEQVRAHRD